MVLDQPRTGHSDDNILATFHDNSRLEYRCHFFEVNRYYVALAALKALADDGELPPTTVAAAIEKYGIDPGKPAPARS